MNSKKSSTESLITVSRGIWDTYVKTAMMAKGMRKISENAINLKIFRCWNSTKDIIKRAPHQLFWPNICKSKRKSN